MESTTKIKRRRIKKKRAVIVDDSRESLITPTHFVSAIAVVMVFVYLIFWLFFS